MAEIVTVSYKAMLQVEHCHVPFATCHSCAPVLIFFYASVLGVNDEKDEMAKAMWEAGGAEEPEEAGKSGRGGDMPATVLLGGTYFSAPLSLSLLKEACWDSP